MVIGLRASGDGDYDARRDRVYPLVQEFIRRFKERHAATSCSALLGCNLSTPEGRVEAKKSGVFDRVCPRAVASAVSILEEMFKEAAP